MYIDFLRGGIDNALIIYLIENLTQILSIVVKYNQVLSRPDGWIQIIPIAIRGSLRRRERWV